MSSSPPPNWHSIVRLLLLAVFPPLIVAITFAHTVTQNPWFIAIIVVIYEIIIIILNFIRKIWQHLEGTWIEQISGWLDIRLRFILSRYKSYYCEYLVYEHRDFDIKGLSTQGIYTLELEQVFVELGIVPTPAHQVSGDPLKVPEALRIGGHSIWEYLAADSLGNQHLVIIGAPGSGKTTLLKHMALTLAKRKKRKKQNRQYMVPNKLPILLFLRNQVNAIKENPNLNLMDIMQFHLNQWERPVPIGWLEYGLRKGHFLVLLDGLDEVSDATLRQQVVNWVQQQMITYGKNCFIITSRPFGYRSNPLSGVTVLEVHSFTPDQIKSFVYNWYAANEIMSSRKDDPGVRMRAKRGSEDLLERLHKKPALFALAVNPLLLTMISTVHRYRGSLPGKRVALYAEICDVFFGKRQEARGQSLELAPAQLRQVLQPLAYQMMIEGIKEIPLIKARTVIANPLARVQPLMSPEMFLELVENTSGLLLERENGIYSFAHLTFQEYLAATHVKEQKKLKHALVSQVGVSWWHETIRLYCAQADATPIIAACIADEKPSIPKLSLALECQEEAIEIQLEVRSKLDALLDQSMEDADSELRLLVIEAMLARRLREMTFISEETFKDTKLITCAEYQIFLDEKGTRNLYYRPDHWPDNHFPQGQGRAPILGVRPSDAIAFCDWLTKREVGGWYYRLPKASEIEDKINRESNSDLLGTDTGYWTDQGNDFSLISNASLLTDSINREKVSIHDVITQKMNSDLTRAIDLKKELAKSQAIHIDPILTKGINHFKHDVFLMHDLDRAIARAINHPLNLTRIIDQALTDQLDDAINAALQLDFDLEFDLEFAKALARARTLDNVTNRTNKRFLSRIYHRISGVFIKIRIIIQNSVKFAY